MQDLEPEAYGISKDLNFNSPEMRYTLKIAKKQLEKLVD
jgi:hypothetical protein